MDRNTTALTQYNYYKLDFTRNELVLIYTALRFYEGLTRDDQQIDTLSSRILEAIEQ